jgi:hypothetical protein
MEISHFSAFSMANYARFAAYVSQAPTLISLQGPTVPSLTRRVARSAARRESNWIAKSKSSLVAGHALSPGPCVGGSEVRIIIAASSSCGLLNQSHTRSISWLVSFRFRSSKRGSVKCYELRNRDTRPRLHDNRRADGRRRMVDFTSIIEGARRWFYSAGQKRIQDRSSRPSVGEPLEPSTPSRSAGFLPGGSKSRARLPAWRSSRRSHGIIFTSGFGRPFPGGAADSIDLKGKPRPRKKNVLFMNDSTTEKREPAKPGPLKPKPQNREPRESNTPAMAGLAIAVVLLVVGLWLAHELRAASKMQDCVLSGRTNCNVIQP